MANEYTPTVWRTGDVITAEKLNNIEEGIANAGGGESDLSTAEVTVVNSLERNCILDSIVIKNGELAREIFADDGRVITVVLYEGVSYYSNIIDPVSGDYVIPSSVSGSIELDEDGGFIITGDCTITIYDNET